MLFWHTVYQFNDRLLKLYSNLVISYYQSLALLILVNDCIEINYDSWK